MLACLYARVRSQVHNYVCVKVFVFWITCLLGIKAFTHFRGLHAVSASAWV